MSDFLKSWLVFKNFLYVKRIPTNSMGGVWEADNQLGKILGVTSGYGGRNEN